MSTNTSPKPSVAQATLPAEIEAESQQALGGGLAELNCANGELERLRRNTGGYFQSEENLKLPLASALRSLEAGKGMHPVRRGPLLQRSAQRPLRAALRGRGMIARPVLPCHQATPHVQTVADWCLN